jgi:hypothetical protein
MSLSHTALAEREILATEKSPKPGKYKVKSTGAPKEVPFDADVDVETLGIEARLLIDKQDRGPIVTLANGDFQVTYESAGRKMLLQFRQTETTSFLFGVSMPAPVEIAQKYMDDPPITGVWGAETRPPNEEPDLGR